MRTKLMLLAPIAVAVLLAGCLGGGDDSEPPAPTIKGATLQTTGQGSTLAQATPEVATATSDITLEYDNVISITVNITVEDGDVNTDPDQVEEVLLEGDGGNSSTSSGGGNTPASIQLKLEWDGTNPLPTAFTFTITVTCNASPDQWPGPFIWRGYPDRGFSYTLDISYQYQDLNPGPM